MMVMVVVKTDKALQLGRSRIRSWGPDSGRLFPFAVR
jgi:hypothetical protein